MATYVVRFITRRDRNYWFPLYVVVAEDQVEAIVKAMAQDGRKSSRNAFDSVTVEPVHADN